MTGLRMAIRGGLLLLVGTAGASAQQPAEAATRACRAPVTIVLQETAPADARFQVAVDSAGNERILLASDATAADLSSAVRTILAARRQRALPSNVLARSRPASSPVPTIPWIGRVLDRLRSAPPTANARSTQIWLPLADSDTRCVRSRMRGGVAGG